MRSVLALPIEFIHFGNTFHYVPAPMRTPEEVILGRIGRHYAREENLAPEEHFEVTRHEGWKASVVVIDPRDHEDGQKVAINHDRVVGRPFSVFASLIDHINEHKEPRPEYHIEVDPIFDAKSFWAFAEENKGDITILTFDLATPNMFDSKENIDTELRELRDAEKAQSVAVTLRGADGLRTDTQTAREAVAYAERGGGSVKARTRRGRRYDSTRNATTVTLEPVPKGSPPEPLLVRAARHITRLLGR